MAVTDTEPDIPGDDMGENMDPPRCLEEQGVLFYDERTTTCVRGITQISAGDDFACALTDTGSIYCWGSNEVGQVGVDQTSNRVPTPHPVSLAQGEFALKIASGSRHSCAVVGRSGGMSVKCWGHNNQGQLGLGDGSEILISPIEVINLPNDKWFNAEASNVSLSLGTFHGCAWMEGDMDEGGFCWGTNQANSLIRQNSDFNASSLAEETLHERLSSMAAHDNSTCVLIPPPTTDNSTELLCYGDIVFPSPDPPSFIEHLAGGEATDVTVGNGFACVKIENGTQDSIRCLSTNPNGTFGYIPSDIQRDGDELGTVETAEELPLKGEILNLTSRGRNGCALVIQEGEDSSDAFCWGASLDIAPRLVSVTKTKATPLGLPDHIMANVTQVEIGSTFGCALDEQKKVWCWGFNDRGQLGRGSVMEESPMKQNPQLVEWPEWEFPSP